MTKNEYINEIKNKLTTKDWAKIKTAKQRKDCAHLYEKSAVDGIDYQECPITGRRMASITGRYIKTLPTTEEEYFKHFPELKEVPEGRKEVDRKAKQKLYEDENGNHILNEDGKPMTVGEVNIMRKMETMKQVGEDGLTGIQRAGQKSRESHMNNVDEYGMNGYNRIASKAIKKGNQTKKEKGINNQTNDYTSAFGRYERIVEFMLRHIKEDGCIPSNTILVRNNSKEEGFQIDHKYSIAEGFKQNVSPLVIGSVYNCQILSWQENMKKGDSCHISLKELLKLTGYSYSESVDEYDAIMDIIEEDAKNNEVHSTVDVLERCGLHGKYFTHIRKQNKNNSL